MKLASEFFPITANGNAPGARRPRNDVPGFNRSNGLRIVELKGWLVAVDPKASEGDPDWKALFAPDVNHLLEIGVDLSTFIRVGDILNFPAERLIDSPLQCVCVPGFHVELDGWAPRNYPQPPPEGWRELSGANSGEYWAFDLRTDGATGQAWDYTNGPPYVKVSGSLVTDQPHYTDPNAFGDIARIWARGADPHDEHNAARWTEIHSPDVFASVANPYPHPAKLVGVAFAAPQVPTSVVTQQLFEFASGSAPAGARLVVDEHVGPESDLGTVSIGNRLGSGASLTVAESADGSATVTISLGVAPTEGRPGLFKAVYVARWESSPPAPGFQHIVYVTGDAHVHELSRPLSGPGDWAHRDVTGSLGAPPDGTARLVSWVDQSYGHVAYLNADGHVHELYQPLASGGDWAHGDLTAYINSPPASAQSFLTGWGDRNYQHVAYVSGDGHVHELYRPLHGSGDWAHNDLTSRVNGPQAFVGGRLTSWAARDYQHIAYLTADGHVHELFFPLGGGADWKDNDLTADLGAASAWGGSSLTSWTDPTYQHVVYLSGDGHVHELYFPLAGGSWGHNDLTAQIGVPPAGGSSRLASWVDGTYQHVVYATGDGHLHELYFPLDGRSGWSHNDLTAYLGAPPAYSVGALTATVDRSYQHVSYLTDDGHIHELYRPLSGSGNWAHDDLTAYISAPPASIDSALTSWAGLL